MKYGKFDMHCHTAEGSTDSDVSIFEYAVRLKRKGFSGMLVTDHNSYDGYLAYQAEQNKLKNFVVLRGIEYDTFDYGHMLVIMPPDTPQQVYRLLTMRGMSLEKLLRLVHRYGGIIGPAHPGGEPFLSFARTKYWRKQAQKRYAQQFDFVEGYNACEDNKSNDIALRFSNRFALPMTGGSDAHRCDGVGLGYAILPKDLKDEDMLIAYYRQMHFPTVGGSRYGRTIKDKLKIWNLYLVVGFFFYNKVLAFLTMPKRKRWGKNFGNRHVRS